MNQITRKLYISFSLCYFLFLSVSAQVSGVIDSPFIAKNGIQQQKEFWNNNYNYPAKPRNQWEFGASFGMPVINGDIPSVLPTFGFGLHARKALGYLFSLRVEYLNGTSKGLMWQPAPVNTKNPAWLDNSVAGYAGNLPNGKGYNAQIRDAQGNLGAISPTINGGKSEFVYYNYKSHIQDLSLQGILTLNNIRFHKNKTKFVLYGGAGIGFTAYHVMVNAMDESKGTNYSVLFRQVKDTYGPGGVIISNKSAILKQLKAGMDNTYETEANSEISARPHLGKNVLRPSGTILLGASYSLGKNISIALEDRHTFLKTDLLDGQQWQGIPYGDVALTSDFDSYNYLSIGINFNVGAKSVEPLWWLNPLDYAYSELNNPRHMKLPKPVFEDTDGDGVTDQLDREPNTTAGVPVDAHGVSIDTDGDGVPDYKDKQLITPSECQPVDADGVGKCPEPPCCGAIKSGILDGTLIPEGNGNKDCPADYPSIVLKGNSLSSDMKAQLAVVAGKLKEHPACNIVITAYPKANKKIQILTKKRVEMITQYLTETLGITSDRITSNLIIEGGDINTYDIKAN